MKKLKVSFFQKGDKNRDGLIAIYGRISLGGTLCSFSTGRYLSAERWIKTDYLRKPSRIENENSLSTYIYSFSESIEKKYSEYLKENKENNLTALDLKKLCFDVKIESKITLLDLLNEHNTYFKQRVIKGERSDKSLEKYVRMLGVVKEFIKVKYKKDNYNYEDIDRKFIYSLDEYLRYERNHNGKMGLANNTSVKYIRNISSMLNHFVVMGIIKDNPFKMYSEKLIEVDAVYLTQDELKKIEDKVFENRRLDVIKDIFLFCCYTSYAPCDSMKLNKNNLVRDNDSDWWIKTKRQKTHVKSDVLILPQLKKIIEKYQDDYECVKGERLIPNRSNAKMNLYLKEIADLCGINKNLTWYVARHTFATTIALANNVPLEVVSAIMGHKRITQTQHYAKIQDVTVKHQMKILSNKFE